MSKVLSILVFIGAAFSAFADSAVMSLPTSTSTTSSDWLYSVEGGTTDKRLAVSTITAGIVPTAVQSFASASNSLAMSTNAVNHYFFLASTAVSITNVTGSIAGFMTYAQCTVSNSLGTSITNYCTVPGAKLFGQVTTNAVIVPAGKEAEWEFECRGINETNYFNCTQQ